MQIIKFYNSYRIPFALSNMTCGGSVVDFEDEVEKIVDVKDIVPAFARMYSQRMIYERPIEVVEKANGIYRLKLKDPYDNEHYLEMKGN